MLKMSFLHKKYACFSILRMLYRNTGKQIFVKFDASMLSNQYFKNNFNEISKILNFFLEKNVFFYQNLAFYPKNI